MLMPSRWDWRMRAYMSTVSILGSFQAEQLRSRSSACGAGYGGSIFRADLTGGGGSLLQADYHIFAAPLVAANILSQFNEFISWVNIFDIFRSGSTYLDFIADIGDNPYVATLLY